MAVDKKPTAAPAAPKVELKPVLEAHALDVTTIGLLAAMVMLNLLIPFILKGDQFAVAAFPATMFILAMTVALIVFVRTIPQSNLKMIIYMVAGFAVYWNVGSVYATLSVGGAGNRGPFILSRTDDLRSLSTVASLGMASAIALLISLADRPQRATMFNMMGLAIPVFGLVSGHIALKSSGTALGFILMMALWAVTTFMVAKGLGGGSKTKYKTPEKIKAGLRGALLGLPLYLVMLVGFLIADNMFEQGTTISDAARGVFRGGNMANIGIYLGAGVGLYVVFQLIVVAVVMLIYDGVLHGMGIERQLLKSGDVRFVRRVEAASAQAAVKKEEKKADPFNPLLAELKKLSKEFDKVDRLNAAQLVNRYKSEFEILAQKNPQAPAKADAEKLLKEIEGMFEKKFG
ncbi:MAG: hypothetical protein HY558_07370 [Euryarchaeota archaeon]|nr:hypothetical protein [Euryarchaeota archaeon]